MRNITHLFLLLVMSLALALPGKAQSVKLIPKEDYVYGALDTENYFRLLADQRVGVVANQTSVVGDTHLVDTLVAAGIDIR